MAAAGGRTAQPCRGRARRLAGRRAGVPARGRRVLRRQQVLLPGRRRPGGHRLLALAGRVDHQRRHHRHPRDHPRARAHQRGRSDDPQPAAGDLRRRRSRAPQPARRRPSARPRTRGRRPPRSPRRPTSATSTRRSVGCCPSCRRKYDDMWTGAKGFYKVEPIVADGGEVDALRAAHHADRRRRTRRSRRSATTAATTSSRSGTASPAITGATSRTPPTCAAPGTYDAEHGERRPGAR